MVYYHSKAELEPDKTTFFIKPRVHVRLDDSALRVGNSVFSYSTIRDCSVSRDVVRITHDSGELLFKITNVDGADGFKRVLDSLLDGNTEEARRHCVERRANVVYILSFFSIMFGVPLIALLFDIDIDCRKWVLGLQWAPVALFAVVSFVLFIWYKRKKRASNV